MLKYIKVLRPQQWYKNLLVFLALFFSRNLTTFYMLKQTIYAFMLLCIISSASYVINDIIDYKRDKYNPEKKDRPIVSEKISRFNALLYSILLYFIGFVFSFLLDKIFLIITVVLAILTLLYSIYFKHIAYLDIFLIGFNYVLRALAGVFVIRVNLTYWFIFIILFFALFLVTGKRYGDLIMLKDKAKNHKPVLFFYNKKILKIMLNIFIVLLLLTYILYCIFTGIQKLLIVLPILAFILLRYYDLILKGHKASRHPEKIWMDEKDWPLIISSVIFVFMVLLIYYI